MGAAGVMAVHIKNAVDILTKDERIKDVIIKAEGEGPFFRFIKVGFPGARNQFEHETENIIGKTCVNKARGNYLFKLCPFKLQSLLGKVLLVLGAKLCFKNAVEKLNEIGVFADDIFNERRGVDGPV